MWWSTISRSGARADASWLMISWQVLRPTIVLSILVYPPPHSCPTTVLSFSFTHNGLYIYRKWQNQQTKNKKVNPGTCILLIWAVFWTACLQKEIIKHQSQLHVRVISSSTSSIHHEPHRLFPLEGLNMLLNPLCYTIAHVFWTRMKCDAAASSVRSFDF